MKLPARTASLTVRMDVFLALLFVILTQFACTSKAGQEKRQAFLDLQKAIQAEDITAIESLLSTESRQLMKQTGLGDDGVVSLIREMSPPDVEVIEPLPVGDQDDLLLKGAGPGFESATGHVKYSYEDGQWKIVKVEWQITMDMTGMGANSYMDNSTLAPWDPNYKTGLGGWRSNAPRFEKIDDTYLAFENDIFVPLASSFIKGDNYQPRASHRIAIENGEFDNLTFTPDGSYLITASYGDYMVRVWDTLTWKQVGRTKMENRPTGVAASPDGEFFVTGDVYSHISFWPLDGGVVGDPLNVKAAAGRHLAVAVSGNARLAATVSPERMLSIWDCRDKKLLTRLETDLGFRCVAFSPAGPVLAAGTTTNKFVLWDLRKGKGRVFTVPKVDESSEVMSISFSPDGRFLVTGHNESSISVWNVEEQKQVHNYYVMDAATMAVDFSPDGEVYATGQNNNHIYIWATESAQRKAVLMGHKGPIHGVAFSPDGQTLASTGEDKSIMIWQ